MIECKSCHRPDFTKNRTPRGSQRYKCRACGYNFTHTPLRGFPEKDKLKALMLYASGLSMNRISKLFGVSHVAVLKWIRALGEKLCPKLGLQKMIKFIIMEVDECWHFIKKKTENSGVAKPMIVIKRDALDWECGDRSLSTLSKLSHRLERGNTLFYFGDRWPGFKALIPPIDTFKERTRPWLLNTIIAGNATGWLAFAAERS